MTGVTYRKQGNRYEMRILGHAGYGAAGRDIVCAAVSMLAATLLQCLRDREAEGALEWLDAESEDGRVEARCRSDDPAVKTLYHTILTGFRLLENQYPEFLYIDTSERRWKETIEHEKRLDEPEPPAI